VTFITILVAGNCLQSFLLPLNEVIDVLLLPLVTRFNRCRAAASCRNDLWDPEAVVWLAGFGRGFEALGCSEGRNVHIDYCFAPAGAEMIQALATSLKSNH